MPICAVTGKSREESVLHSVRSLHIQKLKRQLLNNFYVPYRKHSPENSDGNNQAPGMEPICNRFLQSVDQLLKTPSIEKKASEHILKALYMT